MSNRTKVYIVHDGVTLNGGEVYTDPTQAQEAADEIAASEGSIWYVAELEVIEEMFFKSLDFSTSGSQQN